MFNNFSGLSYIYIFQYHNFSELKGLPKKLQNSNNSNPHDHVYKATKIYDISVKPFY